MFYQKITTLVLFRRLSGLATDFLAMCRKLQTSKRHVRFMFQRQELRTSSGTATVILFEDEGYGGKEQELNKDSPDLPDLTNTFPKGACSIILEENAEKWRVFTQVGYHGAKVNLDPGRRYTSLDAMGLGNPVMSMRKFSVDKIDSTVILYEDEGYGGKTLELTENSQDLEDLTNTFPKGACSIILEENAEEWRVFTQVGYHGAKVNLEPGRRYTSLDAMGLGNPVMSMRKFSVDKTDATVIFYEDEGYGGKTLELKETSQDSEDLTSTFPKGACSIILRENAKEWQVFTQVGYDGTSVTLQPGRHYTSLDAMGLGNPVMSMKKS